MNCGNCGATIDDDGSFSLAMWAGEVVADDDPGEWGGQVCCRECYEAHQRGELPTRDFVRPPTETLEDLLCLP